MKNSTQDLDKKPRKSECLARRRSSVWKAQEVRLNRKHLKAEERAAGSKRARAVSHQDSNWKTAIPITVTLCCIWRNLD